MKRMSSLFKCMPMLLVFTLLVVTAYPIEQVQGEVCESAFAEMKRAAPIEGYLNHTQIDAIQTHCREFETQHQYVNAIQRCQYKLVQFYQWVCRGFS